LRAKRSNPAFAKRQRKLDCFVASAFARRPGREISLAREAKQRISQWRNPPSGDDLTKAGWIAEVRVQTGNSSDDRLFAVSILSAIQAAEDVLRFLGLLPTDRRRHRMSATKG
jgi:hypothetical protein